MEMISALALSELSLTPVGPSVAGQPALNATPTHNTQHMQSCYDREKQAWCVEADTHSETLRIRLIFTDAKNVPRNHLKYVD